MSLDHASEADLSLGYLAACEERNDLREQVSILRAAVSEALEFAEDRFDTVDGPDGQPMPNDAMRLARVLERALIGATAPLRPLGRTA